MERLFTLCAAAGASMLLLMGATNARPEPQAPVAAAVQAQEAPLAAPSGLTANDLPPMGECRLWYDGLAAERQPRATDCEHVEWLARKWGGRVIATTAEGGVELAAYEGRNDFTGVPSSELPRRGYCRAWLDGVPAHAQPPQSDCRTARRIANQNDGRVLFMPI